MKVKLVNQTGSHQRLGTIHDSGLIAFEDGSFSHILHEKQFGIEVSLFKAEAAPSEQSHEGKKPKVKGKSAK